jgi:two-component system KDP operon response regulator KdpE
MDSEFILLVDGDTSIRRVLHTTLGNLGFEILEAASGEDGLWMVHTRPVHAVLLDINLPGMSGIEICRKIRMLSPRIPILMLSAFDSEDDKVEALDAGADDYITKPLRLRELIARIRAAIDRSKVYAEGRIGVPVLDVEY